MGCLTTDKNDAERRILYKNVNFSPPANIMKLQWTILLLMDLQVTLGNIISASVTYTIFDLDTSISPQRLTSPGWSVDSRLRCAIRALAVFPTNRGFLYNDNSGLCTPVLWLVDPAAGYRAASADEGDFYFTCGDEFQLYDVDGKGNMTCLKVITTATDYVTATSACELYGSFLAAVRTVEKLELIKALANSQDLWIGADDMQQEGTFIWQVDGQELTSAEIASVLDDGEPNNLGGEDCLHYRVSKGKINDSNCANTKHFVCEKPIPAT